MALIKCPECAKDVSDAAAACPHCGHPIRQAPPTPAIATAAPERSATTKPSSGAGKGCLTMIGTIAALLIFGGIVKNSSLTACSSDWTKCADNEDLVDHYSDWYRVRSACQRAAEQDAR